MSEIKKVFEKSSLKDFFDCYVDFVQQYIYQAVLDYLSVRYAQDIKLLHESKYLADEFKEFYKQKLIEEMTLLKKEIETMEIKKIKLVDQKIYGLNIIGELTVEVKYKVQLTIVNLKTSLSKKDIIDASVVILFVNTTSGLKISKIVKET